MHRVWRPRPVAATGEATDRLRIPESHPLELGEGRGDTLRLVNPDVRSHAIGPFLVGPGQRGESRLARAGTYSGACTLHADGRSVSIVVRER